MRYSPAEQVTAYLNKRWQAATTTTSTTTNEQYVLDVNDDEWLGIQLVIALLFDVHVIKVQRVVQKLVGGKRIVVREY